MFKLRGCPKCHGDLYTSQDAYGTYLACIQCGRYYAMVEDPARVRRTERAEPSSGPPEMAELNLAA